MSAFLNFVTWYVILMILNIYSVLLLKFLNLLVNCSYIQNVIHI